jgi:hypothetical protein
MENKKTYAALSIMFVVALAVGSVSAFGFGFGPVFGSNDLTDEEKTQMQDFKDQVQTAIENNDYEAWKVLMEEQLNEENFNLLVEQHTQMSEMQTLREELKTAIENGDSETAEELRTQLQELMPEKANANGIGFGRGERHGFGKGMMNEGNCPFADSEDSE